MSRFLSHAAFAALAVFASSFASADTVTFKAPRPRISPHETTSAVVGNDRVVLVYGRPRTADPKTGEMRTIWGGLVPFGQVWRTGADEATLLITGKTLTLGQGAATLTVPAGAYTLYTLPTSADQAMLIVNKEIGQWGTQYDQGEDLGRVPMQKDTVQPALHQFTMAVAKTGPSSGVIKLLWEDVQFSVPFTVTN